MDIVINPKLKARVDGPGWLLRILPPGQTRGRDYVGVRTIPELTQTLLLYEAIEPAQAQWNEPAESLALHLCQHYPIGLVNDRSLRLTFGSDRFSIAWDGFKAHLTDTTTGTTTHFRSGPRALLWAVMREFRRREGKVKYERLDAVILGMAEGMWADAKIVRETVTPAGAS